MNHPERILVVIGTPVADSFVHALARAYTEGAGSAQVRTIDLASDPIPPHPASRGELRMPRDDADIPLEPIAARYIGDVEWAEHVVFIFPQWWGTYPAALKAFIDRVFLSGFAFRYRDRGWTRMLTGRTARLIMTMDSPTWWHRLVYRRAAEVSLKSATLGYCGIRTIGTTRFSEVRYTDPATRAAWITQVAALGSRDAGVASAPVTVAG